MILVTGASGYIGQHLLATQPPHLQVLYQHRDQNFRSPHSIVFDMRDDFENQLLKYPINCIIHLAAVSRMVDCEEDRVNAWKINVEATSRLVQLAGQMNTRFIYLSTDLVFDGEKGRYDESDAPNPVNHYGLTKRHGEIVVQELDNFVIVRSALVFGEAIQHKKNFTIQIIEKLIQGEQVPVFTDEFRTPVWVKDLTLALWKLVDNDFKGILHIGGPQDLSRAAMAEIICDKLHIGKNHLRYCSSDEFAILAKRPKNCTLRSIYAGKLFDFTFTSFEDWIETVAPKFQK